MLTRHTHDHVALRVVAVGCIRTLCRWDWHSAFGIGEVRRVAPGHHAIFPDEVEFVAVDCGVA